MTEAPNWMVLLLIAAEIVNSYETSVTLRQLFYRLVASGRLPNTQNAYKNLSRHTAEARRQGTFPELIDRVRSIHFYQFWNDVPDAIGWVARVYRLNRTIGQRWAIYICIEKAGILEQAQSWFGEYGFPLLALGGYCSQSHIDEVRRHVLSDGRPAVLLYAGDFDASGEDIFRDFVERTNCWTVVRLVALTPQQVQEYNLPKALGKESDSRQRAFVAKHGEMVQVELDALDPEVLRDLFMEQIEKFWDKSTYDAIVDRETRERDILQAQIDRFER